MIRIRINVPVVWLSALLLASAAWSQRLPEGRYHSIRSRSIDILHYRAALRIDMQAEKIAGTAVVRLAPLHALDTVELDAIGLEVTRVRLPETGDELDFSTAGHRLVMQLPARKTPADTFSLEITYSASPRSGMYFVEDAHHPGQYFVTTYGEGGLHANWLPIYSDVNDKFSSEMIVTVPPPYKVISNGKLVEKRKNGEDRITYHWRQDLPHSDYLIALYIGDFEKGELRPAFGKIPLNYWVPRGRLQEGAYAFRNTTAMVEFFSRRFDYTFPWDKYDQIAIPDYAIGAMEHTGVTGHRSSLLRTAGTTQDFNPTPERYADPWSAEALISHELAHHWFGDLLTCRNLSYIWLNESFASYLMMLWDEESRGRDQLLFSVQLAKEAYFDYVRSAHTIRPLEWHEFDDPNTIYNTEHTYYKGAVVLHMLRQILGDERFFSGMAYYLKKHAFANVISTDLQTALNEATGENLAWFFDDWVTGGGHPQLEISEEYLAGKKKIVLRVAQVQPIVDGQDLFELPATVRIDTQAGTRRETVWVDDASETYVFEAAERPLMVSFDGAGDLVAEIDFAKSAEALAYQARHDELPGRLRAVRRLAANYPVSSVTIATFRELLNAKAFWGLRAEVALQLGKVRTLQAEKLIATALRAKDYRVRKAAALALPAFRPAFAAATLKRIIAKDAHDDVVAAAILSLAKVEPDLAPAFFEKQLRRNSWYDEIRYAALRACAVERNKKLLPLVRQYASPKYNQFVHGAALDGWAAMAPDDPGLHETLLARTESPVYDIQQQAIRLLGDLHVSAARHRLEQVVRADTDENLVVAARTALEKIAEVEAK